MESGMPQRGDLTPVRVWLDEHGRTVRLCLEIPNTTKGFVVVERRPRSVKSGPDKLRAIAQRLVREYKIPFEDRIGGSDVRE
jgi:hypothetical protein